MKMPQKKWCNKCECRHFPPTGQKCVKQSETDMDLASVHSETELDVTPKHSQKKSAKTGNQVSTSKTTQVVQQQDEVQKLILEQLKRVNDRMDKVD